MKTYLSLTLALALNLMSCATINRMNNLVNQSTESIYANQQAAEQSTCVIRENARLVEESTRAIEENKRLLEKATSS